MVIIISNTSPIIALARVDALHLILKLFNIEKFYVTAEVFDEIKDKNTRDKVSELISKGKIEVLSEITDVNNLNAIATEIALANPKFDSKTWTLAQHTGEASVIVMGTKHKADFLLMDDIGGRRVANQKGFKCIFHFTIIKQAVEKGILSKSEALKYIEVLEKEYKYENVKYYKGIWSNEQYP